MKNRKLVFVVNTLKVGGAAKMLKYVANILTDVFEEVDIISIYDNDTSCNGVNSSINIIGLGFENVNRLKRQFLMVSAIKKAINSISPSFVCAWIGHVNVMVRMATLRMNNVVVMSAERGDPFTQPLIWRLLTKWAYSKSDFCFFQLDKARDFFGEKTVKHSFVIPNPFVTNCPVEPYFEERQKTIVSAGRFGFEKCYNDLIDAFYIVHKKYPEYRLVLYGEGPMISDYKKQIRDLDIEDFVSFPGYVNSVATEIRKDGIFVLSSLFEGIPNSLIEAMSVGIPCIATDCTPGGPAFLFKNQERGLLVKVHDVNAMADAICRYIENPQYAIEMGRKGVGIIEDLEEKRIRQLWIDAFNKIINYEK